MPQIPREQAKFKRKVFEDNKQHDETGRIFLICYIKNCRIDPQFEEWHADHVIPHYFGGQIGMPCCKHCHQEKTAKQDIPAIAKSKRVRDKHFGIKRKHGWPKRYFAKRELAE